MTDLEISKALALAIGWKQTWLTRATDGTVDVTICITPDGYHPEQWEIFDYRDWNVIGPIAAKYSAFPSSISSGNFKKAKAQGFTDVDEWEVLMYDYRRGSEEKGTWVRTLESTPQKAIAIAVIGTAVLVAGVV